MATSQDRNWEDFLKGLEVNIRPALFGRQSAPKSTDEDIAAVEKEYRGFELPEDYQQFVKQVGPGTLGRVRIYAYEFCPNLNYFYLSTIATLRRHCLGNHH